MLTVNEIFFSLQGESSYTGLPCAFVRLTGCNLRCKWCDTAYAYEEGEEREVEEICDQVSRYPGRLVEVTGGEPLLQQDTLCLLQSLLDRQFRILLETNGSQDIRTVDPQVVKILDLKCPSSGMSDRIMWDNLDWLLPRDEVKFVVSDRDDYLWARGVCKQYQLENRSSVLLSPVHGKLPPQELASWILEDQWQVRFQIQLHKYLWGEKTRAV